MPAQLTAGVARLMEDHGLDLASADFQASPDGGGPLFLELNSGPLFAAFDKAAEGALADALLDWLAPPV